LLRGITPENNDIYTKTGLINAAIEKLQIYKDMQDMLYDVDDPGPLRTLNEILSDKEFYKLLDDFVILRSNCKKQQIGIAEQELAKQKADPRSKERREANERLTKINEEREFLLWKYSHNIDTYLRKLLEVK
jgi:hypothetical protein